MLEEGPAISGRSAPRARACCTRGAESGLVAASDSAAVARRARRVRAEFDRNDVFELGRILCPTNAVLAGRPVRLVRGDEFRDTHLRCQTECFSLSSTTQWVMVPWSQLLEMI